MVTLELIHAYKSVSFVFIRSTQLGQPMMVSHDNLTNRRDIVGDASFKFLPYQLSMVVYWTTMAVTGNEELGFDFGEGA